MRSFDVELELAAQEALRLQPPQQQIRVGNRGLQAAPVTNRAGIGARGFRPHAQHATGIEARDRTSASAYGMYVEHGHAHRQSGDLRVVSGWNRGRGDRAVDERNVGGGSSHVECDDALEAAGARCGGRADDSSGGA